MASRHPRVGAAPAALPQQPRPCVVVRSAAQQQPGTASHPGTECNLGDGWQCNTATAAVHAGDRAQYRTRTSDAITMPIIQSSTFFFEDTQQVLDYAEKRYSSHEYGRYGNPTVKAAEEKIRILEGAEDSLLSASGMCSVTNMLLALVPAGGHVVITNDCYWRTRQFMQEFMPKMGVTVTITKPNDFEALQHALDNHKVSCFFSESPTNPYLQCVDIPKYAKMCHAKVRSSRTAEGCAEEHAGAPPTLHMRSGAPACWPLARPVLSTRTPMCMLQCVLYDKLHLVL